MILPTVRLGMLVTLAGVAGGAMALLGLPPAHVWILLGLCLLCAALDLAWSVRPRDLSAARALPERLYVGAANAVPLEVTTTGGLPVRVQVLDEAPLALAPEPETVRVVVARGRPGRPSSAETPARGATWP